uniref:Uncharacterized protein n=1 Tax=Ixodes ricinus TaxID=34613 RepID=A0A147BCD4_IXORI
MSSRCVIILYGCRFARTLQMKGLARLSILERPIARHFFPYFLLVLFFFLCLYFSFSVVWNVVICPSKVAGSIVLDRTMDGKASRILCLSRFISAVVAHSSRRVPIAKSTFSCFSDGLTLAPSARSTRVRKLAPERGRHALRQSLRVRFWSLRERWRYLICLSRSERR